MIIPLVSLTKTAKKGLELKQKLIEEVSVFCSGFLSNIYIFNLNQFAEAVDMFHTKLSSCLFFSYGNVWTPTETCSYSLWKIWGITSWKTSGQHGNTAGNGTSTTCWFDFFIDLGGHFADFTHGGQFTCGSHFIVCSLALDGATFMYFKDDPNSVIRVDIYIR